MVRVPTAPLAVGRLPLVIVLVSAAYVAWHLDRGWIPLDDGTLAHSAQRVLQGELPHRDFDDVYTGGLALLDAAAFRVLGASLLTLRLVLFAAFVAWVPAVHYVLSRFVRPVTAAGLTLVAVVWSVPNYPAAMPSWYNLFLATVAIAALIAHLEDPRPRWLVAAGIAAGLSFDVKVVGLYCVGGVLLYLVHHSHAVARREMGAGAPRAVAYPAFVTAAMLAFVAALLVLVRQQHTVADLLQFVLPGAALAVMIVRDEWTLPAGTSRARLGSLLRHVLPFLGGVALPIALLLLPYVRAGAVAAFLNGVFVLPARRFGIAALSPGALWTMLALVPVGLAIAVGASAPARARNVVVGVLGVACIALIVVTGTNATAYQWVWHSVRALPPLLAVAGALALASRAGDVPEVVRSRTVLVLAVASMCNLVQFPFAAANYFCYVAPLVLLAAVALWRWLPPMPRAVPATLAAFYLAFAVLRLNPTSLFTMGAAYRPYLPTVPLMLERGGVEVPVEHAELYGAVIPMLRHVARGGYTWASPDMPEVYFLSDLRNPTRTLFEFLDDTTRHTARTMETLEAHGVTAIVLNRAPRFSPPLADDLVSRLERRYPYAANAGDLQLRWRR